MKLRSMFLASYCLAFCSLSLAGVEVTDFDKIELYTLKNESGMTVRVTNFGAIITSIVVPDRDGNMTDVALGYDRVEDYINAVDKPYFGAVVGRYGNRVAKGRFSLDGKEYVLARNNGENHLHGGIIGFDKVVWGAEVRPKENAVTLSYLAKNLEEGYPGNLRASVTYALTEENTIVIDYRATTDETTHVNLTQHTYFNLKGEGEGTILDHELMLNARYYTPIDEGFIPTGEIATVADTPFDFTSPKPIGRDVTQNSAQLINGLGYNHNWVLKRRSADGSPQLAARVREPTTGRVLEVHTTEPGVQFYSGNFLDGRLSGKSGKSYVHRGGFCLETQHFPNSPNQPSFPSTILKPGDEYRTTTHFKFLVE